MKLKLLLLILSCTFSIHAISEVLDRVAIQVNNGVILESSIEQMLHKIKRQAKYNNQRLPQDNVLLEKIKERLILNELQLQIAKRAGIIIGDLKLDLAIKELAEKQNLTSEQLYKKIQSEGLSVSQFREETRNELTVMEVQRIQMRRRIQISEQEVNALVKIIEAQGLKNTKYHLAHILLPTDSNASQVAIEEVKIQADNITKQLKKGADFSQVAMRYSSGSKALDGGDWGYMTMNEVPTLFANNIAKAKKGAIIGPIKSEAGFHILKVIDIKGKKELFVEQVHARHILLKPSPILSDKKAQEMLNDFLIRINKKEDTFAKLAKNYSEDLGSGARGGDLGWANPNIYVPAFKRTLERLKVGQYSKPFKTEHGWHIVQLLDKRTIDSKKAASKNQAYQLIYQRKLNEELQRWFDELKNQAFIKDIEVIQ